MVYEVFVRSFADSDGDGNGDLAGLTAHLDDLNDGSGASTTSLGIDAIWLMPISPSPSYHGYDVTDYEGVNPGYGTLSGFDTFLAAAHARGIKVILDFVLNHSSSSHPWFQDSSSSTGSAKRSWYLWSPTDLGWVAPWNNASGWHYSGTTSQYFWGIFSSGMPDLNYGTSAVEAQIVASMKFWLARGVDGFRLDAVRYLVEDAATGNVQDTAATHALLQRIRSALQADYPDVVLVGEAWAPLETVATYWGGGHELPLAFSFDLASGILYSALHGDAGAVLAVIGRTEAAYANRFFEAPFLSNHDQVRTMRALGGDAGAARVAAATLFAMPGTPFVYYGEELGMQGGSNPDDRDKRTPMQWDGSAAWFGFATTSATPWYWTTVPEAPGVDVASERADPQSLWNLYRSLIAVRHARTGLRHGAAIRPAVTGGGPGVLALVRDAPSDRVLFVANYATTTTGPFTVDVSNATTVWVSEGLSAPPSPSGGKTLVPGLAARGFLYVGLQ